MDSNETRDSDDSFAKGLVVNKQADGDDFLRKLIADVVVPAELQPSNAHAIDETLNAAGEQPLSDSEVQRILQKAMGTAPLGYEQIAKNALPIDAASPRDTRISEDSCRTDFQSVSDGMTFRPTRSRRQTRPSVAAGICAVFVAGIVLFIFGREILRRDSKCFIAENSNAARSKTPAMPSAARSPRHSIGLDGMVARRRPDAPAATSAAVGESIQTYARERRRLTLADGSVLYMNENTAVTVQAKRQIRVDSGEVFVEVSARTGPKNGQSKRFVVEAHQHRITALGTKFAVRANDSDTNILVTQGKVQVGGHSELLSAGQMITLPVENIESQQNESVMSPAPRSSHALSWTKDLMAAAESRLVPESPYGGGALVAVDPSGQETRFELRKYHIDVHIQDGFARTTIDQTYFNKQWSRLEGTFYFPLPPDAALSRLAMYVGENLMEGGMVERNYARNVFEQIMYTKRDPALLEWVDGSTALRSMMLSAVKLTGSSAEMPSRVNAALSTMIRRLCCSAKNVKASLRGMRRKLA